MIGHSLLSGLLLLLPIAATVGIYIGIEFQRIFNGGFKGKYGVPGAGDISPGRNSGPQTNMYCQKLIGITPSGSRYTCELTSFPQFGAMGCCVFLSSLHLVPAVVQYPLPPNFFLQLNRIRSLAVRTVAQRFFSEWKLA